MRYKGGTRPEKRYICGTLAVQMRNKPKQMRKNHPEQTAIFPERYGKDAERVPQHFAQSKRYKGASCPKMMRKLWQNRFFVYMKRVALLFILLIIQVY
jgi:hypothetical protein